MSDGQQLDEEWSNGELIQLSAFIFGGALALLGVAIVEASQGRIWYGVLVLAAPLSVFFGYESGLIPHLKWEIRRRLFPTDPLVERDLE